MKRPTMLMIMDGLGLTDEVKGNAVKAAKTPVLDRLMKEYPFVQGQASGLCARGGYEVSMTWNGGKLKTATVRAKKNGFVTLVCGETVKSLRMKAGQQKKLRF